MVFRVSSELAGSGQWKALCPTKELRLGQWGLQKESKKGRDMTQFRF